MMTCMGEQAEEWEIGRRLRSYREARSLGLNQAAILAGISNTYLSSLERGINRPNWDLLADLSRLYRVPADAILGLPAKEYAPDAIELLELLSRMSPSHRSDLLGIARQFAGSSVEMEQFLLILNEVKRIGGEEARDSLLRFIGRFLPPDVTSGEKPVDPA